MKKVYLLMITGLSGVILTAQSITPEIISTAGDYSVGTNATLSWTLGEPVIETTTSSNAILTQGFQQNNYNVVSIYEKPELNFEITAYPNPTPDILNIKAVNTEQSLILELYDINGKQLQLLEVHKNIVQFNLTEYAGGNYILKASNETGTLLKSWKIVKK